MTKILLVEDDKSLREIYGVRLLAEGYDIVSAGDGEEALAMAIKERPSLIISDVMMPKISGFDMLDILRSTTETKDIKVIMMTALSSEDQRQRGERLGADRYLVKSQVGIEDVVRTVHEVLGDMPNMSPVSQQQSATTQTATSTTPTSATATTPRTQPTTTQSTTPTPVPRPDVASLSPQPGQPATAQPATPAQPQSPTQSSLPRPTAPFSSSNVSRPSNLGERVIQPLQQPEQAPASISKLMDEELSQVDDQAPLPQPSVPTATPPIPTPTPSPQPSTSSTPSQTAPETPTPPSVPAQPQPAPTAPTPTPTATPPTQPPQQPQSPTPPPTVPPTLPTAPPAN